MSKKTFLKSITIYRDYAIRNVLHVDFSRESVTVIYGDNGCGKTTLLRTISAVLSHNESILAQEKIKNVEISYYYKGREYSQRVTREEQTDMIDDEFGKKIKQIKRIYKWDRDTNSTLPKMSSILFGVNRGITSSINISSDELYNSILRTRFANKFESRTEMIRFCTALKESISFSQRLRSGRRISNILDLEDSVLTIDSVSMDVIENLLVERFSREKAINTIKVQNALFDTLSKVAFEKVESEMITDSQYEKCVIKNRNKLLDALRAGEKNSLRDMIIEQLEHENISEGEITTNNTLKLLIVNMSEELDRESAFLQALNTLMKIFNEFIGPEKYLEITERYARIRFYSHKNMFHNLSELSSGEKHLLVLLTIFVIEGGNRDIFMVDEPEISLNMVWQRKLVNVMRELAPNAQLIFASHSPSIAADNTGYLVELR